ncbi:hypothetical protein [Geodermatophilus marinus]|uniref:hypothetical protein n=1 Tax=Geodermatophilus sp. LHW52908 TaxID=2303986 RepID=UPI000E3EA439|nr:hypothetical protein [Geodermatophilus sp. LHW52908]RFU21923.1 hypothetical protein D0Z06_07230 [Geodermatophilus sp. LHW52908]
MAPAPPTPAPGSMTVPLLHGWEDVATFVALVVLAALLLLVAGAIGLAGNSRSEWQAWLAARPSRRDAAEGPRRGLPGGPARDQAGTRSRT